MKKTVSLLLIVLMIVSAFTLFTVGSSAASEIAITPYGEGMENYAGATQILICPKIAGNWTDDWGVELMDYTWELSLTKAGESAADTVRLNPASIYPANNWGIIRFTPCEATGENRFVPEKNAAYTLTVKVYNGQTLLYTADGGDETWTLSDDPIVPDDPEDVTASGDGWELKNGVLTVTAQSALGTAGSSASSYGWDAYRADVYEIVVEEGITAVGKEAFSGCINLAKATFAAGVNTFRMDSLSRNPALKEIIFRGPVTTMGQGVFYQTNNVETVTLTDQTFEEFKEIATKSAYNFESYGGIRTGLDKARYIVRMSFNYTIVDGVMTLSGDEATVGAEDSVVSDYAWCGNAEVTSIVVQPGIALIGAHAFDGMPELTEIRVLGPLSLLGDYAFANAPKLQRIYFADEIGQIGEGVTLGSDALSSVVLANVSKQAFREKALQSAYNFAENGGTESGFDRAVIGTVYTEGFWKGIDDLTVMGADVKRLDVNKNGVVNIEDVTLLLDYLGNPFASWVDTFYNVNNVGGTNINDVTVLLNKLSSICSHAIAHEEALASTCTVNGHAAYYVCAICGRAMTEMHEITAPGHTVVTDRPVAATCAQSGLTAGSHCSVCGEVFTAQEVVPATGNHTLRTVEEAAPTCGKNGYTAGTYCTVCGYAAEGHEVIPATGEHTLTVDAAVAATCLRSGLTEGTHCTVCGNIVTPQTVVAAKGHTYSDSRCIYCGKADTSLLRGKTALFTGDSLCAASTFDTEHQWWGWAQRIKNAYGLASYDKTGADGASVSNCRGNNTIINQINGKKTRTYDYVVLEGGTNDGWDVVSVGTMTPGTAAEATPSSFDLSTFAGGLENLFYYAKQYFPTAKIGYMFTHKMNSNTGTLRNMSAYLAMAKQICQKWDIPMLNVDESPDFAVKYYAGLSSLVPDGIHPSSDGYEMIYPSIARFMAEITLNGGYAEYLADVERVTEGPLPYAPTPDKDEDPQGWIRWLQRDYGETTPMIEGGSAYSRAYTDDGQSHTASPWEYWGGHYQFDYVFAPSLIDLRDGVGTASYPYVWEIWYKDNDVEEDYRFIRTEPWSVYAPSGIYRIDTYDQGMNDLYLEEGKTVNKYDIVIIIYRKDTEEMVGWKKDLINFTDSSVLFMQDALNAGAIG